MYDTIGGKIAFAICIIIALISGVVAIAQMAAHQSNTIAIVIGAIALFALPIIYDW